MRHKHNHAVIIRGVSEHNLKLIEVTIPLNQFVYITGVSSSGKSVSPGLLRPAALT